VTGETVPPREHRPAVWQTVAEARRGLEGVAPVVLVPTMGDLHEGHLDLVRAGLPIGPVVVSVFVNPTQFSPGEDYERYPRRLESDVERLGELGVYGVFAPVVDEMYPPGDSTRVVAGPVAEPLCGRHREGHFVGVATVCTKLFVVLRPQVAVFGEKDAQQCMVLHRLVADLRFDVDLAFVPTRRETDGLAMSSRNRYLQDEERHTARALSEALAIGEEVLGTGEREVVTVESAVTEHLRDRGVDVDYAELRRVPDLIHPERATGRMLLAVAGRVGAARLIDNHCFVIDGHDVRRAPLLDEHTPEAVRRRWATETD